MATRKATNDKPSRQSARTRPSIVSDAAPDDQPFGPKVIDLSGDSSPFITRGKSSIIIDNGDKTVTVDFGGIIGDEDDDGDNDSNFDANLALKMDEHELAPIATEILEGIDQDEQSRKDWMDIRQRGISLLGLKIEEPLGGSGTGTAPVEGMSTVRHSLLTEACVAFQAGARAELLPSAGPVKIRSDQPPGAPVGPPGQATGLGAAPTDELAEALEKDLNHYLTVTAREYVPDTDRMFFTIGFGGDGFKKLYHCPLRRRPVSESVDPEDLIVSNAATDLHNCGRITHRIRMRKSVFRRMQLLKDGYRDVHVPEPPREQPNPVDEITADIGGFTPEPMRPKDVDYTIYECYVELDINRFAPRQFKGKGLPLPYRVTIEKASRKIVEIRRNWREDDDQCTARQVFVQFPFIRALGFYGIGFVHLLGNTVLALTAAMREMLDNGMYANFPAFLYAKQVGRQLSNMFRAPPGGGTPIDLPMGMKIQDAIMPYPYKETGPAFPAFMEHVEKNAKQLAMVSNSPVAEGKQEAPVGTTLAMIEQATKVIASAFKRLHDAQSEEFQILKELFQEDPEAMWRHNRNPAQNWTKEQFRQALKRYELVPVADPNNPTSLHRMAKGALLKSLQTANQGIYDAVAVDRRIMSLAGIDPEGLFKPPAPPAPDPMMAMMQMRMQQQQQSNEIKQQEMQLKALIAAQEQQGKAADRASRERIELLKQQISRAKDEQQLLLERLKINSNELMHTHDQLGQHVDRQQDDGDEDDLSGGLDGSSSPE